MAYSFIALASATNDGSGATLDATASLNVQAGDLLIACCKWEGSDTTIAVAKNSGSPANQFTFDSVDHIVFASSGAASGVGYLLSASADATATFTMTLGVAGTFRKFFVLQFRHSTGAPSLKDGSNCAGGSSANLNSGNFSTTSSDGVAAGFYGNFSSNTTSSEQINGAASTEPTGSPLTSASCWYNILSGSFTNGAATASITSADWSCHGIAFAVSPPVITVPPSKQTKYVGDTATFSVTATGTGVLHYQWKDDGSNVGTDSNSYTTATLVSGDNGSIITCVVTDDVGSTTSNGAVLYVLPTSSYAWTKA